MDNVCQVKYRLEQFSVFYKSFQRITEEVTPVDTDTDQIMAQIAFYFSLPVKLFPIFMLMDPHVLVEFYQILKILSVVP